MRSGLTRGFFRQLTLTISIVRTVADVSSTLKSPRTNAEKLHPRGRDGYSQPAEAKRLVRREFAPDIARDLERDHALQRGRHEHSDRAGTRLAREYTTITQEDRVEQPGSRRLRRDEEARHANAWNSIPQNKDLRNAWSSTQDYVDEPQVQHSQEPISFRTERHHHDIETHAQREENDAPRVDQEYGKSWQRWLRRPETEDSPISRTFDPSNVYRTFHQDRQGGMQRELPAASRQHHDVGQPWQQRHSPRGRHDIVEGPWHQHGQQGELLSWTSDQEGDNQQSQEQGDQREVGLSPFHGQDADAYRPWHSHTRREEISIPPTDQQDDAEWPREQHHQQWSRTHAPKVIEGHEREDYVDPARAHRFLPTEAAASPLLGQDGYDEPMEPGRHDEDGRFLDKRHQLEELPPARHDEPVYWHGQGYDELVHRHGQGEVVGIPAPHWQDDNSHLWNVRRGLEEPHKDVFILPPEGGEAYSHPHLAEPYRGDYDQSGGWHERKQDVIILRPDQEDGHGYGWERRRRLDESDQDGHDEASGWHGQRQEVVILRPDRPRWQDGYAPLRDRWRSQLEEPDHYGNEEPSDWNGRKEDVVILSPDRQEDHVHLQERPAKYIYVEPSDWHDQSKEIAIAPPNLRDDDDDLRYERRQLEETSKDDGDDLVYERHQLEKAGHSEGDQEQNEDRLQEGAHQRIRASTSLQSEKSPSSRKPGERDWSHEKNPSTQGVASDAPAKHELDSRSTGGEHDHHQDAQRNKQHEKANKKKEKAKTQAKADAKQKPKGAASEKAAARKKQENMSEMASLHRDPPIQSGLKKTLQPSTIGSANLTEYVKELSAPLHVQDQRNDSFSPGESNLGDRKAIQAKTLKPDAIDASTDEILDQKMKFLDMLDATQAPVADRLLYVGVFSDAADFEHRTIARKTWMENVGKVYAPSTVRVNFVIGREPAKLKARSGSVSNNTSHPGASSDAEDAAVDPEEVQLDVLLAGESKDHGDLYHVPYEELPVKVLVFFAHAVEQGYRFVMKVDTTHEVRVQQLYASLIKESLGKFLYAGQFMSEPSLLSIEEEASLQRYFTGPCYMASWSLARRISKLHLDHSIMLWSYNVKGKEMDDVDMGQWVAYEDVLLSHSLETNEQEHGSFLTRFGRSSGEDGFHGEGAQHRHATRARVEYRVVDMCVPFDESRSSQSLSDLGKSGAGNATRMEK